MNKKVVRHPATEELFRTAARRFMALRTEHAVAVDRLWAGTLASNFTLRELILLNNYLSQRDHALLKGINRASSL